MLEVRDSPNFALFDADIGLPMPDHDGIEGSTSCGGAFRRLNLEISNLRGRGIDQSAYDAGSELDMGLALRHGRTRLGESEDVEAQVGVVADMDRRARRREDIGRAVPAGADGAADIEYLARLQWRKGA